MTLAIPMVDIPSGATRLLGSLSTKGQPLPLQRVDLRARVIDRVAEVTVEEKFGNPFSDPIEAVYVFPLAGGSAVSRFEMQIGQRVVRGRIEERGQARREYAEALDQGKRAALLEQERDDVFTVQAGNVMPGDEISVRLTYSERLPFFEDGRTELRLPLVVAPRYVAGEELPRAQAGHGVVRDTASVADASRISPPRLAKGFDPKVSLAMEVELFGGFSDLACSQHAVRTSSGPESARVSLSREREPLDRDFVLRWRLAGEQVKAQALVHGGFALLSVLPPARDGFLGAARDVVFVVDRSGSMQGPKLASASRACALLLRTLGPRDRFAVLAFDEVVESMPGGLQQADEGALERGEKWLRRIDARGGTELDSAMAEALQQIRLGTEGGGRVPVKVTGKLAGGGRFEQEIAAREAPLAAIDHLWARARIADMEDEFRGSRSDAVKKEIVAISIRHTVLTRFTAFVVTDDQVVNAGGSRRTVVQPVEMPAEWEMDPMAGIPLTRARGLVLSSPVRAASTYPAGGTSRMPTVKAQASGAMGRFPSKLMDALIRQPPRDEAATAEQREKVQQALEAFLRAFAAAKAGAAAAQLEQARIELLRALGESLAIATAVPLLQAFLRGAAVELVAALTASAAHSALFARHARALDEAREQARAAPGVANAPAGSFWESSI